MPHFKNLGFFFDYELLNGWVEGGGGGVTEKKNYNFKNSKINIAFNQKKKKLHKLIINKLQKKFIKANLLRFSFHTRKQFNNITKT